MSVLAAVVGQAQGRTRVRRQVLFTKDDPKACGVLPSASVVQRDSTRYDHDPGPDDPPRFEPAYRGTLVGAVPDGTKTPTSSLLVECAGDDNPLPLTGNRSVMG